MDSYFDITVRVHHQAGEVQGVEIRANGLAPHAVAGLAEALCAAVVKASEAYATAHQWPLKPAEGYFLTHQLPNPPKP